MLFCYKGAWGDRKVPSSKSKGKKTKGLCVKGLSHANGDNSSPTVSKNQSKMKIGSSGGEKRRATTSQSQSKMKNGASGSDNRRATISNTQSKMKTNGIGGDSSSTKTPSKGKSKVKKCGSRDKAMTKGDMVPGNRRISDFFGTL